MSKKLSASAASFSFNPNAASYSFQPAAAAAAPAPAEAAPAPAPASEPAPTAAAAAAPAAPEPVPVVVEPAPEPKPAPKPAPEPAPEPAAAAAPKKAAPAPAAEEKEDPSAAQKLIEKHGYKPHDEREHLNIVFIGHVDSGKSTISGQILLLTGQVDERTIQKYEREAKEKNRDSWYLAYIMDTNEEERNKGKTVEVGSASFATDKKRYTLLDAPGHKSYVPNMIGGASQADVAVLIISARRSEFEAGFDRGGQTREHALLAKTLGVQRLVVAINKMDEPTVLWSQKRYDEIVKKVAPFLRRTGYKPDDVSYVPISGLTGLNLKDAVGADVCPWLEDRRSLVEELDRLPAMDRNRDGKLRVPVLARYKDMGNTHALGKLQSGTLVRGMTLFVEPVGIKTELIGIEVDDTECDVAYPGENVVLKLKGIAEEELLEGFVICGTVDRPRPCLRFNAQLAVMDLLEHKPVLTCGYTCILHIHTLAVECQIVKLIKTLDKKTGKAKPGPVKFLRSGDVATVRIEVEQSIIVDTFANIPQLGRFTLRDEGRTISVGKVTKLPMAESKQ